ncbi:hypothetical protein L9F63_022332, partial [Diploptera punctata]
FVIGATLIALAVASPANDRANEYDYEDESEPTPAPVSRGRLSLLNNRGSRGPILSSRGATSKQTPAKTTEPPKPAEPEYDEEEGEEIQDDPVTTTTTEAPKKSLVRGGVRPFRSNQDLLAALKRRREQQVHGGSPKVVQAYPTPSSTLPVEENKTTQPVVAEQPESARRPSTRKFSRSKPVAESIESSP